MSNTENYKVGDIINISTFSFINPHGGTGLSNWQYNEKYKGAAEVKITKVWFDYETGIRGWAEPINPELKEYLTKNAKQEDKVRVNEFWDEESNSLKSEEMTIPANTIFWSQFDVI